MEDKVNREIENDDQRMNIEEGSQNNFEAITVKPSDNMKEKKINYTIMGEDVEINPEAQVNHL